MPPARRTATKTAAKKTAAPRTSKLTVMQKQKPKKDEPPKMISADKIAEIYQKAATDNAWCDTGRTSVAKLLKEAGVDVNGPNSRRLFPFMFEIEMNNTARDGSSWYVRETVIKRALKLLAEELQSKYPEGIKIEIPSGAGGTAEVKVFFEPYFTGSNTSALNYYTKLS